MVHGQAEVNFGYNTVLMLPCHNTDDGKRGIIFRSREPGDVTEKELEAAAETINNGNIDVIFTFKSPESFDKLINMLQRIRDDMESELKQQED